MSGKAKTRASPKASKAPKANQAEVPKAAAVCSPSSAEAFVETGTCFSLEALRLLAARWNEANGYAERRIDGVVRASAKELWSELRRRLSPDCGDRSEACWVERGSPLADASLIAAAFAPPKPAAWKKNPRTWLSTTDIDRVMGQYEAVASNRFKWLGALPRDFRDPHPMGGCVTDKMCALDVLAEKGKGVVNLGVVFNLDRHDESGSHWVAAMVCMDPKSSVYGVNFSNSTGSPPVQEIRAWCEDVASTLGCPFVVNRVEKQRKNTECGVFSMYIIIRCLQTYRGIGANGRRLPAGAERPTFEQLCAEPYNDDAMVAMRDRLYRTPQAGGRAKGGGGVRKIRV